MLTVLFVHSSLFFISVSLLFVTLLATSTPYPVFNGYQVMDLSSTTSSGLALQASPWTSQSLVGSSMTSSCGGRYYLGGYDILGSSGYFQRVYTSLPSHNAVYFQVRTVIIDNWQSSDNLQISLDGSSITFSGLSYAHNMAPSNLCGQSTKDLDNFTLVGMFPHTASTFTLQISGLTSNPTVASLGVRGISLIFTTGPTLSSLDYCFRAFDNVVFGNIPTECDCIRGKYNDSTTQSCETCDPSCADCFGSSAGECYVCQAGYSFVGTQCIQCDSSCLTCSGSNPNQCTTCQSGLWLHTVNNTCLGYCNYPVSTQEVVGDFMVCKRPCTPAEYLLWDGSCTSSCPSPLVNATVQGILECNKPCPTGEVLYPDNTCGSGCVSPYQQQTINNVDICTYTSTCASGQYLYWNGSCISSCPSPLVPTVSSLPWLCNPPCSNLLYYYYDWNSSCGATCNSPYSSTQIQSINVCSQLSAQDKAAVAQTVAAMNTAGQVGSGGAIAAALVNSASPSALTMSSLVKMLEYIKYMDIGYPPKVDLMLRSEDKSSLSLNFGPELPEDVKSDFPKHELPIEFEQYEVPSNFIVNFWEAITSLLILMMIIIIASIAFSLTAKHKRANAVFKKIVSMTKWDLCLLFFCSNFDGLGLYFTLQVRTMSGDSVASVFGIISAFLFNLLGVFIIARALYCIFTLRRARYQAVSPLTPVKNLESVNNSSKTFQILFKNFKDNSFLQQSFMCFFLIRVYVFDLIIGCLYPYPLVQAILIIILNVTMILYLLFKRPFKHGINLVRFIFNETILLIVNVNVLILAILDSRESEATETRVKVGDVIIKANVVFNIMAIVFLFLELGVKLYRVIKTIRATKNARKSTLLLRAFVVCMEQDGMELGEGLGHQDQDHKRSALESTSKIQDSPSSNKLSFAIRSSMRRNKDQLFVDIPSKLDEKPLEDMDFSGQTSKQRLLTDRLSFLYPKKNGADSPTTPRTPDLADLMSPGTSPYLIPQRRQTRKKSQFLLQVAPSRESKGDTLALDNVDNLNGLTSKMSVNLSPNYEGGSGEPKSSLFRFPDSPDTASFLRNLSQKRRPSYGAFALGDNVPRKSVVLSEKQAGVELQESVPRTERIERRLRRASIAMDSPTVGLEENDNFGKESR